ncbi:MAG: hypothetical protein AB6733_15020 [Clostridiaceae bacterium]
MIIRFPDDYFFQRSEPTDLRHLNDDMDTGDKINKDYYTKLFDENEDKDDIYSFKFADDEFVEEALK